MGGSARGRARLAASRSRLPRVSNGGREAAGGPAGGPLEAFLADELDLAFRRRLIWLFGALDLAPGLRLLDVGCGPGVHLRALAAAAPGVAAVGLDLGAERLAAARAAGTSSPVIRGDAALLPFPDASFDRVLMSEVLEHLPDDRAALAEVRRVLAPGGVAAFSVPHEDYPFLWDPVNRLVTGLGGRPIRSGPLVGIWTGHQRLYRPDALAAVVRAAGFEVEAVVEATHACIPFAHLLLYGVGRGLVEKGLLPEGLRRRIGRGAAPATPRASRSRFDPVAPLKALLEAVDRRNERASGRRPRTFVNVLLKARRPA